jgi:hypothetical protein
MKEHNVFAVVLFLLVVGFVSVDFGGLTGGVVDDYAAWDKEHIEGKSWSKYNQVYQGPVQSNAYRGSLRRWSSTALTPILQSLSYDGSYNQPSQITLSSLPDASGNWERKAKIYGDYGTIKDFNSDGVINFADFVDLRACTTRVLSESSRNRITLDYAEKELRNSASNTGGCKGPGIVQKMDVNGDGYIARGTDVDMYKSFLLAQNIRRSFI